jgi:hypothetical protein
MWPASFEERLRDWHNLRCDFDSTQVESSLLNINDWWFRAPWKSYYLHWDDQKFWPGPWDLLADNMFCDLARSLGIVYTIMMVDADKKYKIELAHCTEGNLVLVDNGKYIMNWDQGQILNIESANIKIQKTLNSEQLRHLLG